MWVDLVTLTWKECKLLILLCSFGKLYIFNSKILYRFNFKSSVLLLGLGWGGEAAESGETEKMQMRTEWERGTHRERQRRTQSCRHRERDSSGLLPLAREMGCTLRIRFLYAVSIYWAFILSVRRWSLIEHLFCLISRCWVYDVEPVRPGPCRHWAHVLVEEDMFTNGCLLNAFLLLLQSRAPSWIWYHKNCLACFETITWLCL